MLENVEKQVGGVSQNLILSFHVALNMNMTYSCQCWAMWFLSMCDIKEKCSQAGTGQQTVSD